MLLSKGKKTYAYTSKIYWLEDTIMGVVIATGIGWFEEKTNPNKKCLGPCVSKA